MHAVANATGIHLARTAAKMGIIRPLSPNSNSESVQELTKVGPSTFKCFLFD